MGHFSAMVRYKKKYFAILAGLGIAWSRLDERSTAGENTDKDVGLAIPIRIMGHIPPAQALLLGRGRRLYAGRLRQGPPLQRPRPAARRRPLVTEHATTPSGAVV